MSHLKNLAVRGGLLAAVAAGALALAPGALAAPTSPIVTHTGTGPTGYTVTFNYFAPTATSVRLRGEWFFSTVAGTTTTTSLGLLPSQWSAGDFPIANPNQGATANWPVVAMTPDPSNPGYWTYTTPMPPGTYTYGFYVNCTAAAPALNGCTELSDPLNPPWNDVGGVSTGSVEPTSQVYVPSDPMFGLTGTPPAGTLTPSADQSWQAPVTPAGTLADVLYPTTLSTSPVGFHQLAVYLPPNYNPNRAVPYPLLILSHGAGGNEVDWSTQGVANRIADNVIDGNQAQPMVIAMTNFNNLSGGVPGYAQDVVQNVVPYMEANYNVSHNPSDQSFAGLSAGAQRANQILYNNTTSFGYVGVWSIATSGAPANGSPLFNNPALHTRGTIVYGGGLNDEITYPAQNTIEGYLTANGIPFVNDPINAGHEWYTWRILLHDFLTHLVFKTTHTAFAVSTAGSSSTLTATVTPYTNEPTKPTGTVQFYSGSTALGAPQAISAGGVASLTVAANSWTGALSAVYSGDNFYSSSTAALTPVTTATIATPAASGYYTAPATVTLTASAPAGGFPVAHTFYTVDSGATNTYAAPFTVSTDGIHTITFWSTDTSGGTEPVNSRQFTIDTTPPVTTATTNPALVNGQVATAGNVRVTLSRTDATSGVASTFYTVDGGAVQTYATSFNVSGGGLHTVTYWSVDNAGNVEATHTLTIQINPTASSSPGGAVASTLAVSIGATPPAFGTFTAGVAATYTATVGATLTTTAQTSTLSASDACTPAASCFPGYLVNTSAVGGPYRMAQGLQVDATSASASASGGGTYTDLSVTNPATILTYTAPVSNDAVTIGFKQPIGASDPLRTGTYSKAITITLSTSTP